MIDIDKLYIIGKTKLTNDQNRALDNLKKWYNSKELFYVIAGFAGTGKTYVLYYFIQEVIKNKIFCISATTHKALRVIENFTKYKGKTIHSLLGLAPNYDIDNFDINNIKFDYKNQPTIQNYNIVIIDESSMINKALFKYICEQANKYHVKILFIGDPYQLPPIERTTKQNFSDCFLIKNRTILTDVIRQEGNPIEELMPTLIEDIKRGTSNFILNYILKRQSVILNGRGFEILDRNKFEDLILYYFNNETYFENINYFRVLSYTNDSCKYYNNLIRRTLINSKEIVHHNDLFMAYNNIVNQYGKPIIENSLDYFIKQIVPFITDEKIKTYAINLADYELNNSTTPLLLLDNNDKESVRRFSKILNILSEKKNWKQYYKFKEQYILLNPIALDNHTIKKDIDYGYALTIHKSQGSTFENVGIDFNNIINFCKNNVKIYNRLIYVAITRAKNKILIKY